MNFDTALLIAGMILTNSLLTVVTWYYILNKLQENISETLGELKSILDTIKGEKE